MSDSYVGRHRMPEPDDTDTMRLKIVRSVRDLFAIQSADNHHLYTHGQQQLHNQQP